MKFFLFGYPPEATAAHLQAGLSRFFQDVRLRMDLAPAPAAPFCLIEVANDYGYVRRTVDRLQGFLFQGARVWFFVPVFQAHYHLPEA